MNALQPPSRPPHQPRRRVSKRRRQQLQTPHQSIATEATTKLGVNLLLSFIAVTALVKLLPYNMAQQDSFKELQSKVVEVENRVENLQTDFSYHFDPKQARSVMQQESQRQIVWIAPQRATAEAPIQPARAVAQEPETPNAEAAYPAPISEP
jgi:MinD-like ATPase involved in chromosome partitioning or flagellar assembly